ERLAVFTPDGGRGQRPRVVVVIVQRQRQLTEPSLRAHAPGVVACLLDQARADQRDNRTTAQEADDPAPAPRSRSLRFGDHDSSPKVLTSHFAPRGSAHSRMVRSIPAVAT